VFFVCNKMAGYRVGEWVLCDTGKNSEEDLRVMQVGSSVFMRCTGDWFPHVYYSGFAFGVVREEGSPNLKKRHRDSQGGGVSNVRGSSIRGLVGTLVD